MISCLSSDPFFFVSGNRIHAPIYETNDLIPLKPILKPNSFAESQQALVLSHSVDGLEFGKITKDYGMGEFIVSRYCQMTIDKPLKVNSSMHMHLLIYFVSRNYFLVMIITCFTVKAKINWSFTISKG